MLFLSWLLLGVILAAAYVYLIRMFRPEAAPRLLAVGLLIAAVIYLLFALASGDRYWLEIEGAGVLFYGVFAGLGLRRSSLWLAAGWGLHPLWDLALHVSGTGASIAPAWYVTACLSFDVVVAAYIVKQRHLWQQRESMDGAN